MIFPALWSRAGHAAVILSLSLGMCSIRMNAQGETMSGAPNSSAVIRPGQLPFSAYPYLLSQGERLMKSGKERLVMQATLSDSRGARAVRLVWELPGRFRYDEEGSARPIIVDNKTATKVNVELTSTELDALETLFLDSPQGFFESLQSGAAYRFLGRGFRAPVEAGKTSTASAYDIYQVTVPLDYGTAKTVRWKMYYFDSVTNLLSKVRYKIQRGSSVVQVETALSGWVKIDGEAVPGQVQRYEDGKLAVTVTSKGAAMSSAAQDGIFPKP